MDLREKMLCVGLKQNGHYNDHFFAIVTFFFFFLPFLQLILTFYFRVNQDQNWSFKKKMGILLLPFSKKIVLFKFKGLLYAINLAGIETLIEVIMLSLVSS